MMYSGLIDAIGNTPLIELRGLTPRAGVRIFAKLEGANPTGSVKDRIARFMVEGAEKAGTLTPDKIILEPTSGNTGIALAMIGRVKGYRVRVVMPDNVSYERRQLLEIYGAEIVESDGRRGTNGSIELANKLAENPEYFMPYQYGNSMNPRAHYETTGAEIIRDLPDVDVFVAGLGTGGTLMGTGQRLREHNPSVRIVAVEPEQGDLVQGLRSLADGFVPPILDLTLLDRKYLIDSGSAIAGTRALLRTEGIFAGLSSGAVIEGAIRLARGMERGNIVALLADGGWKYISTGAWTQDPGQTEVQLEDKIWW
jgi:[CysO sulfur-carrier protein]-thiocarboxylate-dependent cysteine synthase